MRNMLPRLTTLTVGLGCAAALAGEAGWKTYRDSVEGCRLDYPAALFSAEPFDIGRNVQRFAGDDAHTYFRIMGVDNKDDLSPAEVKSKYLASDIPGDITYERTKDAFLVLSGHRGNSIYYTRISASADRRRLCIFEITYPSGSKRRFDAIVTRMSRSFETLP